MIGRSLIVGNTLISFPLLLIQEKIRSVSGRGGIYIMQYFNDKEFDYLYSIEKLINSNSDNTLDVFTQAVKSKDLDAISMSCKSIVDVCNKIMNIKAPNRFKSIQADINLGCMIFKKAFDELPYKIVHQNWFLDFSNEIYKGNTYLKKAHMKVEHMKSKLEKLMRCLTCHYKI